MVGKINWSQWMVVNKTGRNGWLVKKKKKTKHNVMLVTKQYTMDGW